MATNDKSLIIKSCKLACWEICKIESGFSLNMTWCRNTGSWLPHVKFAKPGVGFACRVFELHRPQTAPQLHGRATARGQLCECRRRRPGYHVFERLRLCTSGT